MFFSKTNNKIPLDLISKYNFKQLEDVVTRGHYTINPTQIPPSIINCKSRGLLYRKFYAYYATKFFYKFFCTEKLWLRKNVLPMLVMSLHHRVLLYKFNTYIATLWFELVSPLYLKNFYQFINFIAKMKGTVNPPILRWQQFYKCLF